MTAKKGSNVDGRTRPGPSYRHRSRSSRRRNSSMPRRGSGAKPLGMAECWSGRNCTRMDCPFEHPADHGMGSAEKTRRESRKATSFRNLSPSPSLPALVRQPPKHKAESALGPLPFREFVEKELDGNYGRENPEEALAKYEEHKKKSTAQALEKFKNTELLFDSYSPLSLRRKHDLQKQNAQANALAFISSLHSGAYAEVCFHAFAGDRDTEIPTGGHLLAPQFAFDPDVNTLLLSGIPPTVSFWNIHDKVKSLSGFLAMSIPQPALSREMRVRFDTVEHLHAARQDISAMEFKGGCNVKVGLVNVASVLRAGIVPFDASQEEGKHIELSAQIIRKLDELMGVPEEVTENLLKRESTHQHKLDVQILYLRRVHHFCYFECQWCDDEWSLRMRCGPSVPVRKVSIEDGECDDVQDTPAEEMKTHECAKFVHLQKLEKFIECARFDQPSVPSLDEERFQSRMDSLCQENTVQVNPQKFQCAQCKKCFKGPEFVHKHLGKIHADLFEQMRREACQSAAEAAYLADPERPGFQSGVIVS